MRLTMLAPVVVLVVGVALAHPLRAQTESLSLDDVVGLYQRGVSARQILHYAQTYCIGFALTDTVQRALRSAGADSATLQGLAGACTTVAPLARSTPGTLLDVDFPAAAGSPASVSSDELCTAIFENAGLHMRNRRRDDACVIDYPSDSLPDRIVLELTVSGLNTSRDAIAVLGFGRASGRDDHYMLRIGGDQRVVLSWTGTVASRTLLDRRIDGIGATASGRDVMRVELRGRAMTVLVNGRPVGVAQAPDDIAGGLMLGVGPRTDALFEHLAVRVLNGAELAKH